MRTPPISVVLSLILAAAFSRLVPHWPNFTPVLAIALFAGSVVRDTRLAYIIPVAAMLLSDLALGLIAGSDYAFHNTQIVVYLCVLGCVAFGTALKNASATRITLVGGTVVGLGFFLITNAAVWMFGTMYPHTIDGLWMSYVAGLAFYRESGNFLLNAIVSTWLYTALLFVLAGVLQPRVTATAVANK